MPRIIVSLFRADFMHSNGKPNAIVRKSLPAYATHADVPFSYVSAQNAGASGCRMSDDVEA